MQVQQIMQYNIFFLLFKPKESKIIKIISISGTNKNTICNSWKTFNIDIC